MNSSGIKTYFWIAQFPSPSPSAAVQRSTDRTCSRVSDKVRRSHSFFLHFCSQIVLKVVSRKVSLSLSALAPTVAVVIGTAAAAATALHTLIMTNESTSQCVCVRQTGQPYYNSKGTTDQMLPHMTIANKREWD